MNVPVSTHPWVTHASMVLARREETADTFSVDLEVDRATHPAGFLFQPGQFNALYVFGLGEVPISISGAPSAPWVLTHTIRRVGSVTDALSKLREGQVVGVRGPFGRAWPVEACAGLDVLVIAGGLGLAPLRPAIELLTTRRPTLEGLTVLIGARSPHDLVFTADYARWGAAAEVGVIVDRAGPDWRGPVGPVTALLERRPIDPGRVLALVCGPEVMMRATARALLARGVTREQIWLSLERSMQCCLGLCGRCQLGRLFVCRDGPVLRLLEVDALLSHREL